jgi:hypothetical protein
MITNQHINTPESFRTLILNTLAVNDDSIYPMTNFFKCCFATKSYLIFNDFVKNNPSSSLTKSDYELAFNSSFSEHSLALFSDNNQLWPDLDVSYFLPGHSFSSLFSDALPSTVNIINNYLINNNYIRPVSNGRVYFTLISNSIFTSSFDDFSVDSSSPDFDSLFSYITDLKSDNARLIQEIEKRDKSINDLQLELQAVQNRTIMRSLMTWS